MSSEGPGEERIAARRGPVHLGANTRSWGIRVFAERLRLIGQVVRLRQTIVVFGRIHIQCLLAGVTLVKNHYHRCLERKHLNKGDESEYTNHA